MGFELCDGDNMFLGDVWRLRRINILSIGKLL